MNARIRFAGGLCVLLLATPAGAANGDGSPPVLRVCADPNNLPFSNAAGEGFENHLAELIGNALGARVEYTWWAQRRGFARNTLKAGKCDVVMGVPTDYGLALTTRPYYRSGYVLLYRKGSAQGLHSLDDPRLRKMRIGVPLVGSDSPPPATVLAQKGMIDNVVGYSVYGDYRTPNPPARLVEAVAHGDVDVAVAWGPLAGYFAKRLGGLEVVPIDAPASPLPFRFSISMGVRKGDRAMKERLDDVLAKKEPQIHALLQEYGVPLLEEPVEPAGSGH